MILTGYKVLALTVVLAVLLGVVGYKGYSLGHASASAKYIAEIQAIRTAAQQEVARQQQVQQATLATYEAKVKEYETQKKLLEEHVEKLNAEARKDPNANRPALGTDSLRRLNTITNPGGVQPTGPSQPTVRPQ